MAVSIIIAGVDHTNDIEPRSFMLSRAITNQTDVVNFSLLRSNGAAYKPNLLDDVQVIEDGVTLFGGTIITMDESVNAMVETVKCTAKDYSFDLDRLLIKSVYQSQSVSAIIKNMVGLGNALTFNGSTNYIVSGSSVPISASTLFSITGRFKRGSAGSIQTFLSQGTASANNGLEIGFDATDHFVFSFYGGNQVATTATYTVDNLWHSYVCTYNSTTNARKIYIDNTLVASDTASADYAGTGVLTIGAGLGGANFFNGQLDETAVRNIEMTQLQVTNHWNRGAGKIESSDATYIIGYHFDETTGTTAVDFVSTNNATLSGGMSSANWVEGNCSTRGFSCANVTGANLISYIAFNYEALSKCLQQLAELIEYDWFVDDKKDIHFFAKSGGISSPFTLTDTSGNYFYNTLTIRKDIKNLRNSVIVRGGQYLGSSVTETQNADGVKTTFLLAYQYSSISVTVAGVSKTVGIDFIDDPATKDCLYNFNEKAIKFPVATKPTAGQAVAVTGTPYIPVIVNVKDAVSMGSLGEYQYKLVDNSINSKEGARDRAKAEIKAWSSTVNEGSFDTITTGLDTGQTLTINSTLRGINQSYVISRITSRMYTPTSFKHNITLVTVNTFGMIEFLQKLLMDKDKEIVINANEVTDSITTADETITISEAIISSKVHNPKSETATIGEVCTPRALNYNSKYVAGPFIPSGQKRVFILNGSPLN